MKTRFLFLLLTSLSLAHAQTKYTVSGNVTDGKTGEELIGASVFITDSASVGTVSNAYGFFL